MKDTQIIYQVFVRNHTQEGTLKALQKDLKRIKDLGVTILYLMPIHEIGIINRKGTYGSPYSIKDYYSISSDLGNLNDFNDLVNGAHSLGLKVMLDMVFNHTSHDSVVLKEHPDFYYRRDGKLANKVGDWSDIIDLETKKEETQNYLIDVLKYWVKQGVDGFRFDVGSLIPLEFFKKARLLLGNNIIFLSESIDLGFHKYTKEIGFDVVSDEESIPIFDILYNYNWYRPFEEFYKYNNPLYIMVEQLNINNLPRISCLENHDNDRVMNLIGNDKTKLMNLIDFMFLVKGHPFIYAGQEYGNSHKPDLFEKDPISHDNDDMEVYEHFKSKIKEKLNEKPIKSQIFSLKNQNTIEVRTVYEDGTKLDKSFSF